MQNTIIKDFSYITGFKNLSTMEKKAVASFEINRSKYGVIGPVNGNSSKVRLMVKYHNLRNKKGQFAAKRK
jgi:hypothetical protein